MASCIKFVFDWIAQGAFKQVHNLEVTSAFVVNGPGLEIPVLQARLERI